MTATAPAALGRTGRRPCPPCFSTRSPPFCQLLGARGDGRRPAALKPLGKPFGAYANGFTHISGNFLKDAPTVKELTHRHDLTPEKYADFAMAWVAQGATIVGGCCEVGPAHIRHLRARLRAEGHRLSDPSLIPDFDYDPPDTPLRSCTRTPPILARQTRRACCPCRASWKAGRIACSPACKPPAGMRCWSTGWIVTPRASSSSPAPRQAQGFLGQEFEQRRRKDLHRPRAGRSQPDEGTVDLPLGSDWEYRPRQKVSPMAAPHRPTGRSSRAPRPKPASA
jgi:hypothetical protein